MADIIKGRESAELEVLSQVDFADLFVVGKVFGGTGLQHPTLEKQVGAVRDAERLVNVVVGDDDADVLVLQRADNALDILHGNGVHTGEGLVEQDEFRVDGDGTGNLGTAPLAAGELDTLALADLLQAELLD